MSLVGLQHYPHLASRIFGVPLVVEPRKLHVILSALAPRLALAELEATPVLEAVRERKPYEIAPGGVAVIDVFGTLVHRSLGLLDALSGLTSYQQLSGELAAALVDPEVNAILLLVDSPGGESTGAFDFADQVFAARGTKPIWSLAEDMADSAGFLIASAAERCLVTQSGEVGSVGVVMAHVDQSAADALAGIKVSYVHAGARKIDGNPHAPLTSGALAAMQGDVDTIYDLFVSKVARNRGLDPQAVRATDAAIYLGASAVRIGFADEVMTIPQVLASLAARAASRPLVTAALPIPTSLTKEKPMSELAPPTVTVDSRDAELVELRAKNQVLEMNATRELKAKRDAVLEKHAKRLAPATLASMKASLDPIEDPEKVDAILSKIPNEVHPAPSGSGALTTAPVQTSDPEAEVIAAAAALREKAPQLTMQKAMSRVLRKSPELRKRASEQRASYKIPTEAP